MVFERRLDLVRRLPDLEQTNRRVEPVEDRQRHRDVSYDSPGPVPEELQMGRPKLRPVLLQSVYGPHRHVGDYEKSHQLPPRLRFGLLRISAPPPPAVQDEDGLEAGLDEGEDLREEGGRRAVGEGEVAADDGEHAVDEHAGLGHHQKGVVQTYSCCPFT